MSVELVELLELELVVTVDVVVVLAAGFFNAGTQSSRRWISLY